MRLFWFRGLLSLFAMKLLVVATFGQAAPQKPKETANTTPIILFVCEHGAAKSVIAATYFDELARAKKLNYKAQFRGTNPDPTLAPGVVQGLKEDRLTAGGKPQLIDKKVMDEAVQIITLGCTLPNADTVSTKLTDWSDIPAPRDYPAARDAIKKRVQALIDELSSKAK
jgi:arsenate reductase (thioredoxin)